MNLILIVCILLLGTFFLHKYLLKAKESSYQVSNYNCEQLDLDQLVALVKDIFNDILKTNLYELNLNKDEFDKRLRNKNQLRRSLKTCTYGDTNAKNYVKDFIKDILLKRLNINEENINDLIPFDHPRQLSVLDKFEILLYVSKSKHGQLGLERLIIDHYLDEPKEDGSYRIVEDDIHDLYKEQIKRLSHFQDQINIVVQRVYEKYKGYGVVDEIRDMKVDGISGGVSGIPTSFYQEVDYDNKTLAELPSSYDSVWIFFKGKTIHLAFLSFGSERELTRICKNIYRYNNPGQLSESNGYKVNEMKDGSRVVVARPPFCESWVFFVRKFDTASGKRLEELIVDPGNEKIIGCLKWLIKGCRVIAVTGQQGTGKTTLLMSLIQFINPAFTLRIQEMAFELHLRKIYPMRNIVSFRETSSISGQEGLDLQKKTDGVVNILGEVATASVSSWLVQMAQVASLFTMFTHHAKTASNLVTALRNALLQTGVFSNEKIAEQQVAQVINFDVHLEKDVRGHRYISRITEIIPIETNKPYPVSFMNEAEPEMQMKAFMETMTEFFIRSTDRVIFETRDIIVYKNGEYKIAYPITEATLVAMKNCMSLKEVEECDTFIRTYWGNQ